MDGDRISRAASAAERLCAVLWEAVHEEMRMGRPLEVAALTDRIAEVCRSVSVVANAGGGGPRQGTASESERHLGDGPAAGSRSPLGAASVVGSEPLAGAAPEAGYDSLADAEPRPDREARLDAAHAGERRVHEAPSVGDRPAALVDEHEGVATPIAIRDVRGSDGTAWAEAIRRRLDRYADDRVPFAVLLIEALDVERLRVAQGPAEAHRQIREVEGAIVEQLRPADALLRESDGRYWLVAPQTDGTVAGALAQRICSASRRAASHRGAPLEVSIGVALCPDHGTDAAALIAHADIDLYAAQAEGRRLGREDDRPPI